MAYIPPHKRHSKDSNRPSPTPTPELLAPQFKRDLNLRSSQHNVHRVGKIINVDKCVYRWFVVDLDDNHRFPAFVHLESISEPIEQTLGEKSLVLVNNHADKGNDELGGNISRRPWEFLAKNVWPDLLTSFNNLRNKMECKELEKVKPKLIARFGKILFRGTNSVNIEKVKKDPVSETTLKRLWRTFYTNVPTSYMENIIGGVVPKIGVDFETDKDVYHIRVIDSTRPKAIINCKCRVKEDKTFELYKARLAYTGIEINFARHMAIDISCVDKNLDLRLMLWTKSIVTDLTDEEMQSLRNLINSAVLDPGVKGGLRWPLGKSNSGDRYRVSGVWHTEVKLYESSSLRLKVRHADRFCFESSTGESTMEITLKLKQLASDILEQKVDTDTIYNMFKDTLGLIWDYFLCCEHFLTKQLVPSSTYSEKCRDLLCLTTLLSLTRHHRAASCFLAYNSLLEKRRDESESNGVLANVHRVLIQIHGLFFEDPTDLGCQDVRTLLRKIRRATLLGCTLFFKDVGDDVAIVWSGAEQRRWELHAKP
ncbi:hypothetical protein Pint_20250 [Pistacia integerrima]|uniref:Uncharacterized protein n=1 Tax=Pistacia integerrima TaxID=434235 RepID=A0ACC0XBU4_9ROSI|nr:hypothetical protein Pint_20250 [Pistacia integerrima]